MCLPWYTASPACKSQIQKLNVLKNSKQPNSLDLKSGKNPRKQPTFFLHLRISIISQATVCYIVSDVNRKKNVGCSQGLLPSNLANAVSICAWFLKCQFGSLLQTWEKKSISKQTWFFVEFKLDFYCLCSLQKSISKSNWFF